jgi:hypothetical protein
MRPVVSILICREATIATATATATATASIMQQI